MGFDMSYHIVGVDQMDKWFFLPMYALINGDDSLMKSVSASQGDDFFSEKYEDVMREIAQQNTPINKVNTEDVLYGLAVTTGFFSRYHYIRGGIFSDLVIQHPDMKRYITLWSEIIPTWLPAPETDLLDGNYATGVYIGPSQVKQLLQDCQSDTSIRSIIHDDFGNDNFNIFLTALQEAAERESGLIEAAEVIEPNPFDLNSSVCYSDIRFCDPQGAIIYQNVAMEQISHIKGLQSQDGQADNSTESSTTKSSMADADGTDTGKKQGFISKLFTRIRKK
ncbi:hypothetical protein EJ419_00020 [Alloscardovia theropitheci]|uniref:Uncharacterized protein n=1 Tax=Alloscardovia theropitheci TaxID=2496842 RepID=A0A4R0QX09_9BIFI|nr:hypothetical protein [Alloscardovia theropitheci]TCD55027.1 hypothetical protein EJ419_00020 [Alloscardovia theropitheci]